MVDLQKRYIAQVRLISDETRINRQRDHLPRLKPPHEQIIRIKHPSQQPCNQHGSTVLPSISRRTSSTSSISNSDVVPFPLTNISNAAELERVSRNTIWQSPQEPSQMYAVANAYPKRSSRYAHVQAKINTGLARTPSSHSAASDTDQPEPLRPIRWSELKYEIEHDLHLRAHTKRMQFHRSPLFATQLAKLGNLVRSKVKSYILFATGSSEHRYKIVVHSTVFPNTASGLHVASRCLWNTDTDTSITIKMHGVDCDILIIVFLCYTELEATET